MKELISQLGGQSFSFDKPSLLSIAKSNPRGFIDQLNTPVQHQEQIDGFGPNKPGEI